MDCFPRGLFRRRSKKPSKLRVTGLCVKGPVARKMFPFDDVIMRDWDAKCWKTYMISQKSQKHWIFYPGRFIWLGMDIIPQLCQLIIKQDRRWNAEQPSATLDP